MIISSCDMECTLSRPQQGEWCIDYILYIGSLLCVVVSDSVLVLSVCVVCVWCVGGGGYSDGSAPGGSLPVLLM